MKIHACALALVAVLLPQAAFAGPVPQESPPRYSGGGEDALAVGGFDTLLREVAGGFQGKVRPAWELLDFGELRLFFEENATDGDLGVQFLLDGEAWRRIALFGPDWRKLLDVRVKGNLREIGLTEIFSESAEPSFDEVPREELIALFDPGEYAFFGLTLEGDLLYGTAALTHDMPAQPVILAPEEDEEVDSDEVLLVEWELVADPNPPESVIEAYHVVVEKDEEDEPLRVYAVDMTASDTSVRVPPEFLEPGKEYKVEVIAVETSDNKTITEIGFETEE